jgi:hypothetical protein
MRNLLRRYWVVLPVLASMATQCDQAPRGAIPSMITSADLVLTSVSASLPTDTDGLAAFASCLQQMDGLPNHVRASWRGNDADVLMETSPGVWTATFFDVPVGFTNTMTVHDVNECARNPDGNGHVVTGVTVNGTVVDRVIGDNVLVFEISADGSVGSSTSTALPTQ